MDRSIDESDLDEMIVEGGGRPVTIGSASTNGLFREFDEETLQGARSPGRLSAREFTVEVKSSWLPTCFPLRTIKTPVIGDDVVLDGVSGYKVRDVEQFGDGAMSKIWVKLT